jgi:hypothetical protein
MCVFFLTAVCIVILFLQENDEIEFGTNSICSKYPFGYLKLFCGIRQNTLHLDSILKNSTE